jgi:hypothetical protein
MLNVQCSINNLRNEEGNLEIYYSDYCGYFDGHCYQPWCNKLHYELRIEAALPQLRINPKRLSA